MWGPPPQQAPQEPGLPVQDSPSPMLTPPPEEAKTDSFFVSLAEPQWGQAVPFQSPERTRISLSFRHFPQWNS